MPPAPPALDTQPFHPDDSSLLQAVWPQLTDDLLDDIARGPWIGEADLYLESLRAFRDFGLPSDTSRWHLYPSEALEIRRWSEIDNPPSQRRPNSVALQHLQRLGCCAALVYAAGHDVMADHSEIETVGALVESAIALGSDYQRQACALVAWRLAAGEPDHPGVTELYLGLGLLLFGARSEHELATLQKVAAWLVHHESGHSPADSEGPWLLRRGANQRADLWRSLVLATAAEPGLPPGLTSQLAQLGAQMGPVESSPTDETI